MGDPQLGGMIVIAILAVAGIITAALLIKSNYEDKREKEKGSSDKAEDL